MIQSIFYIHFFKYLINIRNIFTVMALLMGTLSTSHAMKRLPEKTALGTPVTKRARLLNPPTKDSQLEMNLKDLIVSLQATSNALNEVNNSLYNETESMRKRLEQSKKTLAFIQDIFHPGKYNMLEEKQSSVQSGDENTPSSTMSFSQNQQGPSPVQSKDILIYLLQKIHNQVTETQNNATVAFKTMNDRMTHLEESIQKLEIQPLATIATQGILDLLGSSDSNFDQEFDQFFDNSPKSDD
jgi:hypothetical protein